MELALCPLYSSNVGEYSQLLDSKLFGPIYVTE